MRLPRVTSTRGRRRERGRGEFTFLQLGMTSLEAIRMTAPNSGPSRLFGKRMNCFVDFAWLRRSVRDDGCIYIGEDLLAVDPFPTEAVDTRIRSCPLILP